jgi:2-succinyl-5-enolpyruvyl-6-hydroxy-3-cyclohexene-1-carboxylate synthase
MLADELAAVGAAAGGRPETRWATTWSEADQKADRALLDWLARVEARGEPFEGLPFALLGSLLPDGALLWAGNSMPVRDLDAWLPAGTRSIRPLSNRGANGIDGVVSTALGAAAADVGAVTLVVGDVSFLHDLNALVAARLHGLSATIVLIENDGGGIFSFLSQATTNAPDVGLPDHYEELFGTPHGIDVGPIVAALGGEYRSVSPSELREALADSIARPGVRVLGFRTDRGRNVDLHHEAAAVVADALSRS